MHDGNHQPQSIPLEDFSPLEGYCIYYSVLHTKDIHSQTLIDPHMEGSGVSHQSDLEGPVGL